jgi:hypothetical protein
MCCLLLNWFVHMFSLHTSSDHLVLWPYDCKQTTWVNCFPAYPLFCWLFRFLLHCTYCRSDVAKFSFWKNDQLAVVTRSQFLSSFLLHTTRPVINLVLTKYVITLCVYQINRKVIKRSRIYDVWFPDRSCRLSNCAQFMMVGFLIGHVDTYIFHT